MSASSAYKHKYVLLNPRGVSRWWNNEPDYRGIRKKSSALLNLESLSKRCLYFLRNANVRFISRNAKCPCDSGKRFKNCHMELKPLI